MLIFPLEIKHLFNAANIEGEIAISFLRVRVISYFHQKRRKLISIFPST